MSRFGERFLFFSTSPRNPRLIPKYISVLQENGFEGRIYDIDFQKDAYDCFAKAQVAGKKAQSAKDKAFAARDKLTRSIQALGFVIPRQKHEFQITEAGKLLLNDKLFEDVLLHQLLKFQLPSVLHQETKNKNEGFFHVKPFLELLRLIDELGYLTYQELELFGMLLTDYRKFSYIVENVKIYRNEREKIKGKASLKAFFATTKLKLFNELYSDLIDNGNFKVRESKDTSFRKYLKTKSDDWADYTDSYFRALHATGLVISSQKRTLKISPIRKKEVTYILKNVDRELFPVNVSRDEFDKYISNPHQPVLLNDSLDRIRERLRAEHVKYSSTENIYSLKKKLNDIRDKKQKEVIEQQIFTLKKRSSKDIDDIIDVYKAITNKDIADRSTMFEWNTWRAMTMINHGNIIGNFKVDDAGQPISFASGGEGDIVGEYGNFNIDVEVTLSNGNRQYDMESEPVIRHVGKMQTQLKQPTFGWFIAGKLNRNVINHFYIATLANSDVYSGHVTVIPMDLKQFIEFFKLAVSKNVSTDKMLSINQFAHEKAKETFINEETESKWHSAVIEYMLETVK